VRVWLDNGGRLDAGRRVVLASCLHRLDAVLPLLNDQPADYYGQLRDLVVRTHDRGRRPGTGRRYEPTRTGTGSTITDE
jgi:hypothetical protein